MNTHLPYNAGRSTSNCFATTIWAQVDAAGNVHDPNHQAAIEQLSRKYWEPIHSFVRARGYPTEEAEDLTQEFFLRICDSHWLQRADPQRGRFRTFMLTLLMRFLADQSDLRIRRQLRFERAVVPLSRFPLDQRCAFEPADRLSPETVFFENWVRVLLQRACQHVRDECREAGREPWYDMFDACLLRDSPERLSQVAAAGRWGVSRDHIRNAIAHVRKRLRARLTEELRLEGCPADELDSELSELLKTLTRNAASV